MNRHTDPATIRYLADGNYDHAGRHLGVSGPTEAYLTNQLLEWERDTWLSSNPRESVEHPAFRRIVATGRAAIPFLLEQIRSTPSLLVAALEEITGDQLIPGGKKVSTQEVCDAWLAWGKTNGFLR